jgi:hypothetical protein
MVASDECSSVTGPEPGLARPRLPSVGVAVSAGTDADEVGVVPPFPRPARSDDDRRSSVERSVPPRPDGCTSPLVSVVSAANSPASSSGLIAPLRSAGVEGGNGFSAGAGFNALDDDGAGGGGIPARVWLPAGGGWIGRIRPCEPVVGPSARAPPLPAWSRGGGRIDRPGFRRGGRSGLASGGCAWSGMVSAAAPRVRLSAGRHVIMSSLLIG